MADWGSIGKAAGLPAKLPAVSQSIGTGSGRRLGDPRAPGRIFSGMATTVSGTVTEGGSPVAGRIVVAFRKSDHLRMGKATTDASGHYSIETGGATEVYVVAFDPTTYQAIVYDRVTPS